MDKFQSHFSGCSEFVNFDMVVTFRLTVLYHNTLLFMLQSHITIKLSQTLYFSLIVSVIFIFGELGTRICLAFKTIVK